MTAPDSTAAALTAISAVDGRYAAQSAALADYFSESALIRRRIEIELAWLETIIPYLNPTAADDRLSAAIADIRQEAQTLAAAAAVKALEAETKHDVKAVEYWIGGQLQQRQLEALCPYIHFACTSWDINNLALALQVTEAVREVMHPAFAALAERIRRHAAAAADIPMLARTHGQPASPTTVGKEFANVYARLQPRLQRLAAFTLPAKFNGAVGNYNAHIAAVPELDWPAISRRFIEQHGLSAATHTTQIEPYDDLAELFDLMRRINTILLDLCRDCWGYISLEYFIQQRGDGKSETGSSTMPHKINPIDFENAEGNLGIASSLFAHFGDKLPVSRWQRDLSDSTVLRAIGSAFAHSLIAARAAHAGLGKIIVNPAKLAADLDGNWAVLSEAVQTVLRAEGVKDAYEQLKALSRGNEVTAGRLHDYIKTLPLGDAARQRLLALTPATYCGLAAELTRQLTDSADADLR